MVFVVQPNKGKQMNSNHMRDWADKEQYRCRPRKMRAVDYLKTVAAFIVGFTVLASTMIVF